MKAEYKLADIVLEQTIIGIICFALLMLLLAHDYIFESNMFSLTINSDLIRANVPYYTLLYDELFNGLGFWSWAIGIGTSSYAHVANMCDPFVYICFINGRENIPNMMVWSFIVKVIIEGMAFSLYVRWFKVNAIPRVLASVMYAFSGYSIVMGTNLALGTIMVYFPLLCLSIEYMLERKDKSSFSIILFMIAIYSHYYLYVSSVLSILYFLVRIRQKRLKIRNYIGTFILWGAIGVLMSSFIVLPEYLLTADSARLNSGKDIVLGLHLLKFDIVALGTTALRTININFLGDGVDKYYLGWSHDYFSCELYTLTCAVPLIIYYYHTNPSNKFKVKLYCLIVFLFIAFPIVPFIFNAFSTINYRYLFVFHFINAIICAKALDYLMRNGVTELKLIRNNMAFLLISVFVFITGILIYKFGLNGYKEYLYRGNIAYYFITCFIYYLFYAGLMLLKKKSRYAKTKFVAIMVLVIGLDVCCNYSNWLSYSSSAYVLEEKSHYGYDGNSKFVIDNIKNKDDGFYRIYKNFDSVYDIDGVPSDNDALVQKYKGLKGYCSINNGNYVKFLQEFGVYVAFLPNVYKYKLDGIIPKEIKGPQLNFINGIDDKYPLLNYLGVKYYLRKVKDDDGRDLPPTYEYAYTDHDINVYVSSNNKPLAFFTKKYISHTEFSLLAYDEKIKKLADYTVLSDMDFGWLCKNEVDENYVNDIKWVNSDFVRVNVYTSADNGDYINFTIPYDRGWKAYIDDELTDVKCINIGMVGVKVPKGTHVIDLKYKPYGFDTGCMISIMGLLIFLVMVYYKRCEQFTFIDTIKNEN